MTTCFNHRFCPCILIAALMLLSACSSSAVFIAPPASSWEAASMVVELDGNQRTFSGAKVRKAFFQETPVHPMLGRAFLDDDHASASRAVVVSEKFWRDVLGDNPDWVGKEIVVDNERRTIVGIMPRVFDAPPGAALWIPIDESEKR
ncbi:MAG: ABC transporter permease [Acidobacteriota bacterium]